MDWTAELKPEERDALIEQAAQIIARRRLETPAILFLEMHRPLTFLSSQALILFGPLLAAFWGPERIHRLSQLLADRRHLDRLIDRIEELAARRLEPPDHRAPRAEPAVAPHADE